MVVMTGNGAKMLVRRPTARVYVRGKTKQYPGMEDAAGNQLAEVDQQMHHRSVEEEIAVAIAVEGSIDSPFETQN